MNLGWEKGKTVNKFQVLICKMYLVVYLYHKDYKRFLMDRKSYFEARLGVLFALKFSFILLFFYEYITPNSISESEENLILVFYILSGYFIVDNIGSYARKNYEKVSLNISQKEVKIIYYSWHIALVGFLILEELSLD